MSRQRRPAPSTHRYPRAARHGETLREVIAEELVRIDDERLAFVTVTSIDVDPEMNRAVVYYDSLADSDSADIRDALAAHRVRLQSAVARQVRSKKTPVLDFRPDEVIQSAMRIEQILRDAETLPPRQADQDAGADGET